jgi:hypothetical protein
MERAWGASFTSPTDNVRQPAHSQSLSALSKLSSGRDCLTGSTFDGAAFTVAVTTIVFMEKC